MNHGSKSVAESARETGEQLRRRTVGFVLTFMQARQRRHLTSLNHLRLCGVLAGLQVADGVLTGIGVAYLGFEAEGNVMLRLLMEAVGLVPALLLVKSLALFSLFPLLAYVNEVRWLPVMLKSVILLYAIFAIIPWGVVLCTRIYGV